MAVVSNHSDFVIQSVFTLLYIGESCGANTWNIYYYTILELLFNINSNINSYKFLIQTVKMASAWGKVPQVQPVDLSDIMSEEVAKDLQKKEFAYFENATAQALVAINPGENLIPEIKDDKLDEIAVKELLYDEAEVQDDLEIAMMLQQQYDKEYDDMLKRTEDKYNGSSKVSVSFTNYRRATLNPDFESDTDEEEEPENPKKDWDRFDGVQRDLKAMPPCGYHIKNGNMVTKHDTTLNGRRNACRMMSFPPECETGDGAGFDLQLSNKVFNSLRKHSKNELVRRHRVDRKEEQATAEFGMDEATRLLIYRMVNNQMLQNVNGVISIGKEAVVLHADANQEYKDVEVPLPAECVLKVFKTTLSEYKQRDKYIKNDHRFKDRMGKQNTKKVVHLWAEKEMRNLLRLQKAAVPVPRVVALKQHVLVMSFIGKKNKPAPKLKDANLSDADLIIAYDQVLEAMHNFYHKANLIHADLSEYNILWYKDQCHFIDVSQSVEPSHENAFYFLLRDCTNISKFFSKKCVPGVSTPEEIFKSIVGCDYGDRVGQLELQERFKMKPHLVDRPGVDLDYRFDNAWERTERAKKETPAVTESPILPDVDMPKSV